MHILQHCFVLHQAVGAKHGCLRQVINLPTESQDSCIPVFIKASNGQVLPVCLSIQGSGLVDGRGAYRATPCGSAAIAVCHSPALAPRRGHKSISIVKKHTWHGVKQLSAGYLSTSARVMYVPPSSPIAPSQVTAAAEDKPVCYAVFPGAQACC